MTLSSLQLFVTYGNCLANQVWAPAVPAAEQLRPESTEEKRSEFIQNKYSRGRYRRVHALTSSRSMMNQVRTCGRTQVTLRRKRSRVDDDDDVSEAVSGGCYRRRGGNDVTDLLRSKGLYLSLRLLISPTMSLSEPSHLCTGILI